MVPRDLLSKLFVTFILLNTKGKKGRQAGTLTVILVQRFPLRSG